MYLGIKSTSRRAKVGINTDKDMYMNREPNVLFDGDGRGPTR